MEHFSRYTLQAIRLSSSWFGYFKDNSTHELIPLSQTPLYRKDWIGLRSLDRMGRLHFAACSCQHIKVPTASCKVEAFDRSTRDFLKPEMAGTALLRWLPFVPSRPRPPFGRTPYQKIAAELEETLDKVRTLETEVAKARERAAVAERGLRRVQGKETRPVAAAAWRAAIGRTGEKSAGSFKISPHALPDSGGCSLHRRTTTTHRTISPSPPSRRSALHSDATQLSPTHTQYFTHSSRLAGAKRAHHRGATALEGDIPTRVKQGRHVAALPSMRLPRKSIICISWPDALSPSSSWSRHPPRFRSPRGRAARATRSRAAATRAPPRPSRRPV